MPAPFPCRPRGIRNLSVMRRTHRPDFSWVAARSTTRHIRCDVEQSGSFECRQQHYHRNQGGTGRVDRCQQRRRDLGHHAQSWCSVGTTRKPTRYPAGDHQQSGHHRRPEDRFRNVAVGHAEPSSGPPSASFGITAVGGTASSLITTYQHRRSRSRPAHLRHWFLPSAPSSQRWSA